MAVLTIVTQMSRETVYMYFDNPIPKVDFIKLISCSLFNSSHNLKHIGTMYFEDEQIVSLTKGHYSVDSLAKELTTSFENFKKKVKFEIEINKPNSVLTIANWEADSKKEIASAPSFA